MELKQLKEETNDKELNTINNFFDSSYSRVYADLLDIELEAQVNFLETTYFHNNSHKQIRSLDLCCGSGRHLKELCKKGYCVDGVDINPTVVNEARESINGAKIYLSDAQIFNPKCNYDLVYSMESSIGYLPDEQTVKILRNVKDNLLTSDGIFVLHLINREYTVKNLTQRIWFGNSINGYLLEDRIFDPNQGSLKIHQLRIIDGIAKNYSIKLRLYSLKEIEFLLNEAGLKIKNVYGDYSNSTYCMDSPYMIIECFKYQS